MFMLQSPHADMQVRIKLVKMKYVLSSVHKGNIIKQRGVKWLCENYYTEPVY